MKAVGYLKTSSGDEIKITRDMLEDFYVISRVYNMPIESLIEEFFDGKFETNSKN